MEAADRLAAELPRVLRIRARLPREDRPLEFADDLCFTTDMVEAFINAYTVPRAVVMDPFAGFGTSLVVAERLGRVPTGFEILPDRVAFTRSRLTDPSAVQLGDARGVNWAALPKADLVISSPPYMTRDDHAQNPLSGYQRLDGDYGQYLRDLQAIYAGIGTQACHPHARIVVNVANLGSTRLAWDVGSALADVLEFEREIVLDWDEPQDWFTQDYCLVFRPPQGA
jgi:tRNA G10  N-methylase Trm11